MHFTDDYRFVIAESVEEETKKTVSSSGPVTTTSQGKKLEEVC